ncbi:MAG: histidinol dehydrogenase [Bacteroidetes bacterium RBG_13_44_24]|nr:MAG: histidinol dehydrogenase [Bacteroidetes bacterium RBG_13_44_24]
MKTILFPATETWLRLCSRPVIERTGLDETVKTILNNVKTAGDKALYDYSLMYDGTSLDDIKVSQEEIEESINQIAPEVKKAISIAAANIEKFHRAQLLAEDVVETMPGVKCWRKNVPVEKAGLYIPGGTAPLFSTVLMLGIPARIAGCSEVVMCTPPDMNGKINPLVLYSALLTGITGIYKVGGAQAIAAMAYGTETVPKVYKVFGPGNQYVTRAKELVQSDGVAIDMPAGPSEVMVIADNNADPEFVAADLLSQAEHGADSQVVLVTDSKNLIARVMSAIQKQLASLPRKVIAMQALDKSFMLLLPDMDNCLDFSNMYAPEHLIINTSNAADLAEKVKNAGSVFIGKYSCESAGDYASGTNHTLPTNGYAKCYSGVSVDSFIRKITFQEITREGMELIGPAVEILAEAESLQAHSNAVKIRLEKERDDWFR